MDIVAKTPKVFSFTFVAALDNDSLYLAGTVDELENRDVHHTIRWERVSGAWKRYQWNNRTYALAAYFRDAASTAVYMGYEGTLKVRSNLLGSSEEVVEDNRDGPSSLRTISSVRVIDDYLYISGMRRMVYRRPLSEATWSRFDDGIRLQQADLSIAGLYSIDGHDPLNLYAAGLNGEIWHYSQALWARVNSPTNLTLLTVRCLPDGLVVVGGEKGILLVGNDGSWTQVIHSFTDETFRCIEWWRGRCFVGSDDGVLYELQLGKNLELNVLPINKLPFVSWIAATSKRVWFVGGNTVMSLGDDGWRDDSPPQSTLEV